MRAELLSDIELPKVTASKDDNAKTDPTATLPRIEKPELKRVDALMDIVLPVRRKSFMLTAK
jgi:hypothetical protein